MICCKEDTFDAETQTDGPAVNKTFSETLQRFCDDSEVRNRRGLINGFVSFIQANLKMLFLSDMCNKASQTFVDTLAVDGERLSRDVVLYLLKEDLNLLHADKLSVCMRSCVVEMLNKHDILFTSFAKRLCSPPETIHEKLEELVEELFLGDGVTWTRIIALYALIGRLALYCREKNMDRLARRMPHFISSYMYKITPFVRRNGGWNKFCEEFPVLEDMSNKVWRSLLLTGASLGLVATLLAVHS